MFGGAIDRRNNFIAEHDDANVAPRFFDVLLQIKNFVEKMAQHRFVFEQRFGGFAVIHFGYESAPRTDDGFQDDGIAHRFNRFERGFGRERDFRARRGNIVL